MMNASFSQLACVPAAPPGAPSYLGHLLGRLRQALEADDPSAAHLALRDTLGFLSRYFACMLATASGAAAQRPGSTRDAELTYQTLLAPMVAGPGRVAPSLRQVFFRADTPYTHTWLLVGEWCLASGGRSLVEWLAAPAATHLCQSDVDVLLPVLSQWLEASGAYFGECAHSYRIEPRYLRGLEGGTRIPLKRVELVTHYGHVRAGMPLRARDLPRVNVVAEVESLRRRVCDEPLPVPASLPVSFGEGRPATAPTPMDQATTAPLPRSPWSTVGPLLALLVAYALAMWTLSPVWLAR